MTKNKSGRQGIRINRFLAQAGISSRRKSEDLINAGLITINDRKAVLGDIVVPETDTVFYKGEQVSLDVKKVYYVLHKPAGVLSSVGDDRGRKSVVDIIDCKERIFPVGRLDLDVTGVLLLTNDGDLSYCLTHPKFELKKIYHATVEGTPRKSDLSEMKNGIEINGNICKVYDFKILKNSRYLSEAELEVVMTEGRKREVKQLLKAVGHPVISLQRISFAGITVRDMSIGTYRYLREDEIAQLKKMCGLI